MVSVPYGRRLVIDVVEQRASDPHWHRPYALLPKSSNPNDGFYPLTFPMLRDAVDRTAHFLDRTLGKATGGLTFAWLGPATDTRYYLLMLACMKTGHVVFLTSPRNSIEAHLALLESTNSQAFLDPQEAPVQIVHQLVERRPMSHSSMPPLAHFLDTTAPREPYPLRGSFDELRRVPCLILHTSGSTGLPKPIIIRHGWFTTPDSYHLLSTIGSSDPGFIAFADRNVFIPFPNFHSAGVIMKLPLAVFYDYTVIESPNAPLNVDLVNRCLLTTGAQCAAIPASVLRDLSQDPESLHNLGRLEAVAYGGSPLAEDVGSIISKKTKIINCYGITEICVLPFEVTDHEDWGWIKVRSSSGVEFRYVADDNYELVLVRKPELDLFQGIFITEPNDSEWHTKDLWSKHPTKPDLWHYQGRMDDIIVFENGEKLNAITMQDTIESHPDVAGALVAGAGHFQSCLLVEPRKPVSEAEQAAFISKIWPIVQQANAETVAHGRVSKGLVLISRPDKPFLRADKGSIKKRVTLALYEEEINQLYADYEASSAADAPRLDLSSFDTARSGLRQLITQLTELKQLKDDEDFFSVGMDSLQASNIARSINSASSGLLKLEPRNIYANSTLDALASLASGKSASSATGPTETREEAMSSLLSSVADDLPINGRPAQPKAAAAPHVVLLTGSTGSLGSYLLDLLVGNSAVSHIYCVNRAPDARERQHLSHTDRALTTDFSKATFLTAADFSKPYLSLDVATYTSLLDSVTLVLHNAWPVNFNRSLSSFASHVRGARRMVDLCASSRHAARLSFVSTIASAGAYAGPEASVPERIFPNWTATQPSGYGESKAVAERLLDAAASRSGVHATVIRLGQVAGPVAHGDAGVWNRAEWLPALLASSVHLGLVPDALGPVPLDWVPVDACAAAVLQLALHPDLSQQAAGASGATTSTSIDEGARVRHVVNPTTTTWSSILPSILTSLPAPARPTPVPFATWLAALQASAASEAASDANPAAKLLPFYEGLVAAGDAAAARLATVQSCAESDVLAGLEPVSEGWVRTWMRQWRFA